MADFSNPLWIQKVDMGKNTKISAFNSREDYKNNKSLDITIFSGEKKTINNIIDKVKGLDGNNKDLTEQDFINAKTISIFGKNTTVRIDSSVGLATVQLENGKVYSFDFETKQERNERILDTLQKKFGKQCDIEDAGDGVNITVKENRKGVKVGDILPNGKIIADYNSEYFDNEELGPVRALFNKDGDSMSEGEWDFVYNYRLPSGHTFYLPYDAMDF